MQVREIKIDKKPSLKISSKEIARLILSKNMYSKCMKFAIEILSIQFGFKYLWLSLIAIDSKFYSSFGDRKFFSFLINSGRIFPQKAFIFLAIEKNDWNFCFKSFCSFTLLDIY